MELVLFSYLHNYHTNIRKFPARYGSRATMDNKRGPLVSISFPDHFSPHSTSVAKNGLGTLASINLAIFSIASKKTKLLCKQIIDCMLSSDCKLRFESRDKDRTSLRSGLGSHRPERRWLWTRSRCSTL